MSNFDAKNTLNRKKSQKDKWFHFLSSNWPNLTKKCYKNGGKAPKGQMVPFSRIYTPPRPFSPTHMFVDEHGASRWKSPFEKLSESLGLFFFWQNRTEFLPRFCGAACFVCGGWSPNVFPNVLEVMHQRSRSASPYLELVSQSSHSVTPKICPWHEDTERLATPVLVSHDVQGINAQLGVAWDLRLQPPSQKQLTINGQGFLSPNSKKSKRVSRKSDIHSLMGSFVTLAWLGFHLVGPRPRAERPRNAYFNILICSRPGSYAELVLRPQTFEKFS